MRLSSLKPILFSLLMYSIDGLERVVEETQECSVSASGEKVCTNREVEENNGSMYFEGEDEDDYDDDDEEKGDDDEEECVDTHENCSFWASIGECSKNPNYMLKGCAKSCNSCPKKMAGGLTADQNQESAVLLAEIEKYGEPQEVGTVAEQAARTMFVIRKTVDYMKNFIHSEKPTHELSKETLDACLNNDSRCSYWVSLGECEANPSYMVTKCAPACLSCHKIDYKIRCGERDPDAPPGLKPGELNLMFERIVETAPGNVSDATQLAAQEGGVQEDGTPIYTVTVHSRPESPSPKADENGVVPIDAKKDAEESPWVITFDNFLTDEECQHLIDRGYKNGYERSTDVGRRLPDGSYDKMQSNGRTSENAWCESRSGCRQDPVVDRIMKRMANVTGVPDENYEDLQLLKYDVGQFYRPHHDYIGHQRNRHNGPRILTFFLYLSDVEEGGGTKLNDLDIEIKPKKGRALLWPSVMNYNPLDKDGRTRHEARAVEKGRKFAANAWIHLFNNVEAHKLGCN